MSNVNKLFNAKAVILDLKSTNKNDALNEIATKLFDEKFISDKDAFLKGLQKREQEFSTGLGDGIAIPHAQNDAVIKNVVLIAKSKNGIDWDSSDGQPAKIFFSIALNSKDASQQVNVLQELSGLMMDSNVIKSVLEAKSIDGVIKALTKIKSQEVNKATIAKSKGQKKLVAITACPTGIAHTYLAAKSLENAAKELGFSYKIETQGRNTDGTLSQKDIDEADGIILAIDKGIDGMDRFNGKKVLKIATKAAIKDAKGVITKALAGEGEVIKAASGASKTNVAGDLSWASFKDVYKNLMGGVSRMLPFVVAGGIILGIAFLLDSGITGGNFGVTRSVSRWFAGLGKASFSVFIPILGGYVAYSIVGAEGLLPGFVAGIIASGGGILYNTAFADTGWSDLWGGLTPSIDQAVLSAGSGFIGAMAGGYVAAIMVIVLRKYVFNRAKEIFRGVVSIIAIPVLSVLMTGVSMFVLQIPLAYFSYGLKLGLEGLASNNLMWLLTTILAVMMAADMGGPINKVAYTFGTGLIGATTAGAADYQVMGAVMIGGMVPPMAIAFSTIVFRDKAFSKADQTAGMTNWLMGAFFITEGAIPFAAKDPKRVLPSLILGSALAGLMMGLLQVGVSAPHGGIFVFALMKSYLFNGTGLQIGMGVIFAIAAIAAGAATGGMVYGLWRKMAVKSGKVNLAI